MAYASNASEAAVSEALKTSMRTILTEGCSEASITAAMTSQQATDSPQLSNALEAIALALVRVKLPTYAVAGLPSASTWGAGALVYVSNGAAGSPVVAFSDGSAWRRVDTLATVASS